MKKKGQDEGDRYSVMQAFGFVSGIGIHCAVTIAVCVYLGKKVDAFFAFAPWGTIGGIVAGFLAAIWSTYKKLLGKRQ